MKIFYILTRGRTGSTAVIDSLNKTNSICTAQELFLKYNFNRNVERFIMPYDLWLEQTPFLQRMYGKLLNNEVLIDSYLRMAEGRAMSTGKTAFGFKVLSHHFDQRPNLKDALLERGYRAIYLRRNVPRQVISNIVARLRGKYNAHANEKYEDDSRYTIDIGEFESLVNVEIQAITHDLDVLESGGGGFIEVTYEDFMADRHSFFNRIFDFLGVSADTPQESEYSIMIKNISHVVENYQAVVESATAMGLIIE